MLPVASLLNLQFISCACSLRYVCVSLYTCVVWTPDPTHEEGSGEKPCLEVSSWNTTVSEFSKLPLSDLQRDWSGTTPILCSTLYLLPVIILTQTLVGWSDVGSLINTDSSIPALKTLPGKLFPQTLPHGLGLGSRLILVLVLEPSAWCWSVLPTHTYSAGPHPSQE